MRLHTTLAGALISATAALESVPADAFQSVARGRVAVVDDFLARDVVAALRGDAETRERTPPGPDDGAARLPYAARARRFEG